MKKLLAILFVVVILFGAILAAQADDGEAKYAFVMKPFSNQFWAAIRDGAIEEGEKLGVTVDCYGVETEDNVEGQVQLMENVMQKGYDAICVAPISDTNMLQPIATATKNGVIVVNVDLMSDLDSLKALGGSLYAFVASDNQQIGGMGGQYIVDHVAPGSEVAVILGNMGNAGSENRGKGAADAMEAGGLNVVEIQPADYDRTKAFDVATNYLSKYPDLKGIYCCNDVMALGVVEAAKKAGREDLIVVGTDGDEEAVNSINAGELSATVAQDPVGMGARSLQLMVEAVQNNAIITAETDPIMEGVDAYIIALNK